jgi:agmatine deiminase
VSRTLTGRPKTDGFHMPGEFQPHQGCWMIWPERPDNWRLGAKPAQAAFAAAAEAIAEFEPVTVLVSAAGFENARLRLPPAVRVVEMTADDAWMRDVGPTFVVDGQGGLRGVDWRFNAWGGLDGGLYFPWRRDQQVARKVLDLERVDRYAAPLVLEGGSIHVDGQGTLIATAECLLHPNRNPDLSRPEIESLLADYTGADKIVWLDRGVYMDETDGHVDNLCCFVRPGEALLTWTDDRSDPQWERSQAAFDTLSSAVDARGRTLTVHKIHQPGPLFLTAEEAAGVDRSETAAPRQAGDRLAASYVNFYPANGGLVAPVFGDPQDQPALQTLQRLFPDRRVVGIPAREILLGGGNIHCVTQQQPIGRPA